MTAACRVVLIGSRSTQSVVAYRILRELGIPVPLIISGDEDPGEDDWRLSLAKAARRDRYVDGENLFIIHNPHASEPLQRIHDAEVDLILSVQWRRILRPAIWDLARVGAVNLHNAPLPLLRGCDPFSWAIYDGLAVMGVTLHQIDQGVDSGAIFGQRLWPITPSTTAWQLYQESVLQAETLLRETLPDILTNKIDPQPQVERYSSYHPLGQFEFAPLEIDWNMPATALSCWIRSRIFPPFQLPFFSFNRQQVEVLECQAVVGNGIAGTVTRVNPLRIAASRGSIEISAVRVKDDEVRGAKIADRLRLREGNIAA